MSGRRVLITGASGFVGRALCEGFDDLGWSVIGLDREAAPSWTEGRVGWVESDLALGVPDPVGEVDLLIHAAWVTTAPEALGIDAETYRTINLGPLGTVLGWWASRSRTSLVFLSSSGVFAATDDVDGLTDKGVATGASPYAVSKREGETRVAQHTASNPRFVVRLGYLYGPDESTRPSRNGVSLVRRWIDSARAGEPLEVREDDPRREWTYLPDVAGALQGIEAMPVPRHPIHLCSPHVRKDSEMAEQVAAHFGETGRRSIPAAAPQKAPMIPSDLSCVRDVAWTRPEDGLKHLAARLAAA